MLSVAEETWRLVSRDPTIAREGRVLKASPRFGRLEASCETLAETATLQNRRGGASQA